MSEASILYEKRGAVAIITLNRPDKLNAFNTKMHEALRLTLDMIGRESDIRCLLLTGSGRGFCAGQDLGDRAVSGDQRVDLGETVGRDYNPLIKRLHNSDIPTVCAVNGVAAGAGANIALACDIVIASKKAKFVEVFANIGLLPDSGGTYHLPRHVGLARALGMSLLGEPVRAEIAKDWGLIWETAEPDALMDKALAIAGALAAKPPLGLRQIRKAIRESFDHNLDEQTEIERQSMRELGFTDDYAEAVSAFLEKRTPKFKGT